MFIGRNSKSYPIRASFKDWSPIVRTQHILVQLKCKEQGAEAASESIVVIVVALFHHWDGQGSHLDENGIEISPVNIPDRASPGNLTTREGKRRYSKIFDNLDRCLHTGPWLGRMTAGRAAQRSSTYNLQPVFGSSASSESSMCCVKLPSSPGRGEELPSSASTSIWHTSTE